MANHKSAEKRLRQTAKRNLRNRGNRSTARGLVKAARDAITTKPAEAVDAVKDAISALAKAARKGAMPKRRADRKISRLQKGLNKSAQG